jgi:hypothetical protein
VLFFKVCAYTIVKSKTGNLASMEREANHHGVLIFYYLKNRVLVLKTCGLAKSSMNKVCA